MGMERMTDVGCGGEGGGRKEEKGFFLVVEKAVEETQGTQGQTLETQKMLENTGERYGKNYKCGMWWKGWRMRKGKEGEVR